MLDVIEEIFAVYGNAPSAVIITALFSLGMTYIITGSEIGFWPRLVWCFLLRWHPITRYWWAVVRCPPCNAFWTGFFCFWVALDSFWFAACFAVIQCGLVAVLQKLLGGNGLAADENMHADLGVEE